MNSLLFPINILLVIVSALWIFIFMLKPERSTYICVLLLFVPISIGHYRGNTLPISYLAIPAFTVIYLLHKLTQRSPIYSLQRSLNPLLIPILIYFMVVFSNYFRNPIDLANIIYKAQGLRVWIGYFLCFCCYLIFSEVVATKIEITQRFIRFLFQLCIILSILGVILIFSYSVLKFLLYLHNLGLFYNFYGGGGDISSTHYRLYGGGYRIGTLQSVAPISLILLLTKVYKVNNSLKWILYVFLWFSLALSGGRSFFLGMVLALVVWLIIQKNPRYLIAIPIIFLFFYLGLFVYYDILPGFLQRILQIRDAFATFEPRVYLFSLYWESFLRINPLFGVSIGSVEFSTSFDWENLRVGGHGTYISILYLFGLVGFIPFVWGLVKGLKHSYSLSKRVNDKDKSLAMFCFLWLTYFLVPMTFGGKGSDLMYFAVLGIISGLCIRQKISGKLLNIIGK